MRGQSRQALSFSLGILGRVHESVGHRPQDAAGLVFKILATETLCLKEEPIMKPRASSKKQSWCTV